MPGLKGNPLDHAPSSCQAVRTERSTSPLTVTYCCVRRQSSPVVIISISLDRSESKRQDHQLKQMPDSEIDEATCSVPSHWVDGSRDNRCSVESLVERVIAFSDTTGSRFAGTD